MRLQDLAQLYAAIARGGKTVRVITDTADRPKGPQAAAAGRTLIGPVAAWYVTDVLKDSPPPASSIGGRIAYKTGTSYGYRDAWAVGYDGQHTVAVWVGRADGSATPGLTGRSSAAPLLFDAFQRLGATRAPLPAAPAAAVRGPASSLPPPLKRFHEPGDDRIAGPYLDEPVQISFPPDRAEVEREDEDTPLILKAQGGALPLIWMADDVPIETNPNSRDVAWQPDGRGFVKLTVVDAKGRVDRVTVRVR
jgi:penicillin-binding protein 1C